MAKGLLDSTSNTNAELESPALTVLYLNTVCAANTASIFSGLIVLAVHQLRNRAHHNHGAPASGMYWCF